MENIAIILGLYLNDDGSMQHALVERLYAGYRLYAEKKADKLLLTGGTVNQKAGRSEAQAMADYLVKKGVPSTDLILEEQSHHTIENAKYCKEILKGREKGVRFLVSSSSHLYRSYLNPIRIFNWMYRIKAKIRSATDWNLELPNGFLSERENFLVVYKKKAELAALPSDVNIFLKKRAGVVRKGFFPVRYQKALESMLILSLRDMYGIDAIECKEI